ncbi:Ribonuclease/ribotoxin [Mycena olivaceomarginata]|nr:Ribonuclease/ribotoxin [Mycena olivaceomarginata]
MFPHSLIVVASALSALVLAVPTGAQANVSCGRNVFTTAKVTAAVDDGYQRVKDNRIIDRTYPKAYRNTDRLSMACGGNSMFEFPLVAGGRAFTGGDPGPDRVIFNESRILCAVITHSGAPGNTFVSCKVSCVEIFYTSGPC